MKAVLHNYGEGNTKVGLLWGLLGGFGKYLLQIHTPFWQNLTQAIFTALICGAAGVAGKELYITIRKRIKNRKT